jgi:hypothetical protein
MVEAPTRISILLNCWDELLQISPTWQSTRHTERTASLRELACPEVVEVVVFRLVTLGTQTGDVEGLDIRLDAGRRLTVWNLSPFLDRSAHFGDGPVFIRLGRGASSHPGDMTHTACRSLDTDHAIVRHDGLCQSPPRMATLRRKSQPVVWLPVADLVAASAEGGAPGFDAGLYSSGAGARRRR